MNNHVEEENIPSIDIIEILKELISKMWFIILVTIAVSASLFVVSVFFITPLYQSTTSIYVLNNNSNSTISNNDFQVSNQLVNDYEQLIKSREIINTTIQDLSLNTSYSELKNNISVVTTKDTRILNISVKSIDPYEAQKIANKVRELARDQIINIMNIDAVNTIDEANLNLSPVSPKITQNTLIGAVIGFIISIIIVSLKCIFDDSIKTTDDIEKRLDLSIIGIIPMDKKSNIKRRI